MSAKMLLMRAVGPAPVLNTPQWDKVFCDPLPLDSQKLLRPVETILFPGSLVQVVAKTTTKNIVQIKTDEYPGSELYTDERFLKAAEDATPRKAVCPTLDELLFRLKNWPKAVYIWGGNCTEGIPLLATYYPLPEKVDPLTKMIWTLKGVDCSGLLYEATNGFLPRNTSQLIKLGSGVAIAGKNAQQIAELVKPGDLIVWKGHVIIVEKEGTVFESAAPLGGTARSKIIDRLKEIMTVKQRIPVDVYDDSPGKLCFVVRRWLLPAQGENELSNRGSRGLDVAQAGEPREGKA